MTQENTINANTAIGNFDFLKQHDPIFLQLAQSAERAFSSDPNTTLVKLRQFAEAIAQDQAEREALALAVKAAKKPAKKPRAKKAKA